MFCSKLLRINRFNKFVLNNTKFNIFNVQYISSSVDIPKNNEENMKDFEDWRKTKENAENKSNQFANDLSFRKDILQNVFVLSQNVTKGNKSLNELISENDFNFMCETIDENIRLLNNRHLFNCLHSFLLLNLDNDLKIIRSLENEVLWRARRLSLKEILFCLSFHNRFQSTELQKKVMIELIMNLVLKLDNTNDIDDIIQLLNLSHTLSPELMEWIEMTALQMIGRNDENIFKMNSLSYILVLLAQKNRRTKALIKAVLNRFTYSSFDEKECREEHLIKMISALNQLNYCDIDFLKKASDFLCNKKFLNNVMASDRRDLLVAVSQLKWSYPRLLDQYIEKITDSNNDFSSQDYLVMISSFARLYYRSPYLNDILNYYVNPFIKREDFECESWLLYVWSLSILGCVPLSLINSVLNEEFYRQLMSETQHKSNENQNFKQIIAKLKLLNIKAIAEIEMNEKINFNLLSEQNYEIKKKESSVEKLKKSIQQSLGFISNISTNVLTPFGFNIDAEFIINNELVSLPFKQFGSLKDNHFNELPQLPDGYKRCAVLCFGFNDTLLDESGFIGIDELYIRLLKRLGYEVLKITETSFPSYYKSSQKTDKLKNSLKLLFNP